MAIDHKHEAAMSACRKFWAGIRDRYQHEGAASALGAACPYQPTSFAALHWRHGAATRETGNCETESR